MNRAQPQEITDGYTSIPTSQKLFQVLRNGRGKQNSVNTTGASNCATSLNGRKLITVEESMRTLAVSARAFGTLKYVPAATFPCGTVATKAVMPFNHNYNNQGKISGYKVGFNYAMHRLIACIYYGSKNLAA